VVVHHWRRRFGRGPQSKILFAVVSRQRGRGRLSVSIGLCERGRRRRRRRRGRRLEYRLLRLLV
jgi:hypothetical protein